MLIRKQMEIAKKYQDEFVSKRDKLDESEVKALTTELDAKLATELKEKLGEEQKALEEKGKAEAELELGDEKHTKIKELFEKHAHEKYLKKEVYVQVADALGI